jgi:hypothetical protein
VADVRSGSWLCENAKTPDGDRRSYSSKTVLALKRASVLNSESELKNVILTAFRSLAFSHSQGHSRPNWTVRATSGLPRSTDIIRSGQLVRFVPFPDSCTTAIAPSLLATRSAKHDAKAMPFSVQTSMMKGRPSLHVDRSRKTGQTRRSDRRNAMRWRAAGDAARAQRLQCSWR